MKYFDLKSVVEAYEQISTTTKDKFWGVLGVLYSIDSIVESNRIYKVDATRLSTFLESIFRLYNKKEYDGNGAYSVAFSDHWAKSVSEGFLVGRPSIWPVIIWAYRNRAFEEKMSTQSVYDQFLREFHLTESILETMFSLDFDDELVRFSGVAYSDMELLKALGGKKISETPTIKMNHVFVVANAGDLTRGPFFQPLYASLNTLECLIIFPFNASNYYKIFTTSETKSIKGSINTKARQVIFYGAPGTGKSHEINKECCKHKHFRITFHPDTDYASFVGAYKPSTYQEQVFTNMGDKAIPLKDSVTGANVTTTKITYSYVCQAFLKAYISAWKEQQNETPDPVFLIIEEINRGNCAQIFGDIFQLLDRNKSGFSDYPIVADDDMKQELEKVFEDLEVVNADEINNLYEGGQDVVAWVKSGSHLLLPNNLYIWATMNTSDQSLFPIDSAFKRRWDWKYIKIKNSSKNYRIVFSNGNEYDWWEFLMAINDRIEGGDIQQEDKKLGYFFVKPEEDGVISAEKFLSKVIFYLYNDVFKDFGFEEDFFKDEAGKVMTFASYFDPNGEVDESRVERFITNVLDSDMPESIVSHGNNGGRDNTKFRINGQGERVDKKKIAVELVKTYVSQHPEFNASEIIEAWKPFEKFVSHFMESEEEYNQRVNIKGKQPRAEKVDCGGGGAVYVATNGYGTLEKMRKLQELLKETDLGLEITPDKNETAD